jgi:hypothetical protein
VRREAGSEFVAWGAGIAQSLVGQGVHQLFQWFVKPAIEGRAGHLGHHKFQIRPQDISLVGSARRAGRNDHRPDQHPGVQLALPLNHPALHAQAFDILLWQNVSNTSRTSLPVMLAPPYVLWPLLASS